ncbi:MAG: 2-hydroxychromene-2-carboxylate isomerase [Deltaproteobacteria bacterium]|nr:2-hydroxychromene-2-carboxylate isomerase [Deltaproteobacteria bacterium]
MADTLEFWFDFASTYSYPAAERVEEVAARHGLVVEWRPFLLGPIFQKQLGITTSPFNLNPVRGHYMWRDVERLCAAQALPFKKPSVFPRNSVLPARVALTLPQGLLPLFVRSVFRANFVDDLDISDAQVLRPLLSALGLDAVSYLTRAASAEEKPKLRAQTERADALGLFGAPSFIRGGELFFGGDRLEQAAAWKPAV